MLMALDLRIPQVLTTIISSFRTLIFRVVNNTGKESKTQKTSNPIYINQFALKECSTKSIISSIITKEKSTATKNSKTYPLCLISK